MALSRQHMYTGSPLRCLQLMDVDLPMPIAFHAGASSEDQGDQLASQKLAPARRRNRRMAFAHLTLCAPPSCAGIEASLRGQAGQAWHMGKTWEPSSPAFTTGRCQRTTFDWRKIYRRLRSNVLHPHGPPPILCPRKSGPGTQDELPEMPWRLLEPSICVSLFAWDGKLPQDQRSLGTGMSLWQMTLIGNGAACCWRMTCTSKPCTARCLNLFLEDLTVLP